MCRFILERVFVCVVAATVAAFFVALMFNWFLGNWGIDRFVLFLLGIERGDQQQTRRIHNQIALYEQVSPLSYMRQGCRSDQVSS